jgi:hypothetical protein
MPRAAAARPPVPNYAGLLGPGSAYNAVSRCADKSGVRDSSLG